MIDWILFSLLYVVFNLGLEWLPWQDASHDLLVALHPPYSLILWNADTGTKLWKKSYTETLTSFSLDPFSYRNIACKFIKWHSEERGLTLYQMTNFRLVHFESICRRQNKSD